VGSFVNVDDDDLPRHFVFVGGGSFCRIAVPPTEEAIKPSLIVAREIVPQPSFAVEFGLYAVSPLDVVETVGIGES